MSIARWKQKIRSQKGEIATILTLLSVGLMLVGVVVGNVAVQQQTRTQSRAQGDFMIKCYKNSVGNIGNNCEDTTNFIIVNNYSCPSDYPYSLCSTPTPTPIASPTLPAAITTPTAPAATATPSTSPPATTIPPATIVPAATTAPTSSTTPASSPSPSSPTPTTGTECIDMGENGCILKLCQAENGHCKSRRYCCPAGVNPPATTPTTTTSPVGGNSKLSCTERQNCDPDKPVSDSEIKDQSLPSCSGFRAPEKRCLTTNADTGHLQQYECLPDKPGSSNFKWYKVKDELSFDCTVEGKTAPTIAQPNNECTRFITEKFGGDFSGVDCRVQITPPDNKKCTPGATWYDCVPNRACPYDSRLGVGRPFWCGADGKTSYLMNIYGECTWACPASGQPAPTKDPACGGLNDGDAIQGGKCQAMHCASVGNSKATYWINIVKGCKNGYSYSSPGSSTGIPCDLKTGTEMFADCTTDRSKIVPTVVEDKREKAKGSPGTGTKKVSQDGTTTCGLPIGDYFEGLKGNENKCVSCLAKALKNETWLNKDVKNAVQKKNSKWDSCDTYNLAQYWCSGGRNTTEGEGLVDNNQSSADCLDKYIKSGTVCANDCKDVEVNKSSGSRSDISSEKITSSNDKCSVAFPKAVVKGSSFTVTVTTTNPQYCDASNVKLKFGDRSWEGGATGTQNGCPTSSNTTWTFGDKTLSTDGTFTVSAQFQKGGTTYSCGGDKSIEVKETGVTTSGCKLNYSNPLPAKCAACLQDTSEGKIGLDIYKSSEYGDCTTVDKINYWCGKENSNCNKGMESASCKVTTGSTASYPCRVNTSDEKSSTVSFPNLSVQSYSNKGFEAFIEGVKKGYYTAIDASLYVLNATRVPGLQRLYCDPFKGQCDFYYQQTL